MSTLKLRAARPNDAGKLASIQYASIQSLSDLLPQSYVESKSEEGLQLLWDHELKSSIRKTFVAESYQDEMAGFVSFGPSQDVDLSDRPAGEILRLYLAPNFIGKGTGTVLLEHAISVLQNRGFDPIMLWVFEVNTRARRFYLDHGFEEDDQSRYDGGLLMRRYFWNKR